MNMSLALRENAPRTAAFEQSELDFLAYVIRNAKHSNSQIFQDLWVQFELGDKRDGYFVEFGACDGRTFSNSYMLEAKYGWNGVIAEPGRTWHDRLMKNRACFISRDCVYTKTGETILFNETSEAELSAIDTFSDRDQHAAARAEGNRYQVKTISLRDLLIAAKAPREIDYLSIDTEGSELDILSVFDFDEYRFQLITVEHNYTPLRQELYDFLVRKGYKRKFMPFSQFDDWYVRVT